MLKILKVPNDFLNKPTQEVNAFDDKLHVLLKEMEETLTVQKDPQGVGLAANQVGLNLSVFIIKPTPESGIESYINPRIIKSEKNKETKSRSAKNRKNSLEGCLSIPKIWGPVNRSKKIYLEYQDKKGKLKRKWYSGFKAVIIEHEIDHLNGVVFTQRVLEQKNHLFLEEEGELNKLEY